MILFTAVPGTYGFDRRDEDRWFRSTSAWSTFAQTHGFEPLDVDDPFFWSGDINGLEGWRRWFGWLKINKAGDHNDWAAGGLALRWYLHAARARRLAKLPPGLRGALVQPDIVNQLVVAHSHGGQVALYAAAAGQLMPVLITVSTPVRADMAKVVELARPNIGYWLHICASDADKMMFFGGLGDGAIGREREMIGANLNALVSDVRHSRLLEDPRYFHEWIDRGWFELIRAQLQTDA